MISKDKQAAHMLLGKELSGGWKVIKKIEGKIHKSGGVYSATYDVINGDRKGFLKAFDYSAAEKVGREYPEHLKEILNSFSIEKEILEMCTRNDCRNIIKILESGSLEVGELSKYPRVEYLILEYADEGDVKDLLEAKKIDLEWKMRSLHQLAKGLKELHALEIAHQDIKPSNIVSMGEGKTKITDFGSAISLNPGSRELPLHLDKPYSGSWEYAPPELLYGYVHSNPSIRRVGCDLYLLGSMVALYFTDMSMTSLIKYNLDDRLCWTNTANNGDYNSVKSYVIMAFEKALEDIAERIEDVDLKETVVKSVKYLCHPDPAERGHIKSIIETGNNYSLERFITMFDVMARKIKLRKK